MKVDPFIEAEKVAGRSVNHACGLLKVSRAAYYQRRNGKASIREVTDTELTEKITAVHKESKGTYGSPRVHRELRDQGLSCGKRRVTRLMRIAGLEGRCKKRWRKTTVVHPDAERALDLIQRHFGPCTEIDRRYVGDITYVATWEGWAYLATVIDLASRGWSAGRSRTTCGPSSSKTRCRWPFRRAVQKGSHLPLRQGLSIHEQGLRRARPQQRRRLVGRTQGRVLGQCRGRIIFRNHQARLIYTRAWPTRAGLRRAVFEYIEGWYNTRRLHSTLGYMSPAKYEALHRNADRQAA